MILPTNASLMLTENCNLACKYCFEKHNTKIMTNEIIRKSLNYLFNNSLNSNKNSVNIIRRRTTFKYTRGKRGTRIRFLFITN